LNNLGIHAADIFDNDGLAEKLKDPGTLHKQWY
jgi:hypothetical protein